MRIASIGYIVERFALKQVICCQNRQRFSANHLDKVASSSIYAVFRNKIYQMQQSSSVWGCGLKFAALHSRGLFLCVILRVRMWIEIKSGRDPKTGKWVILRVRMWIEIDNPLLAGCHPSGHPPCEDVDWNVYYINLQSKMAASSSVWGCGLKFQLLGLQIFANQVILRVRMWIEMYSTTQSSGDDTVILRVRMWIEIKSPEKIIGMPTGHPPCEDVDWNCGRSWLSITARAILRVRMWIEI